MDTGGPRLNPGVPNLSGGAGPVAKLSLQGLSTSCHAEWIQVSGTCGTGETSCDSILVEAGTRIGAFAVEDGQFAIEFVADANEEIQVRAMFGGELGSALSLGGINPVSVLSIN